MKETVSIIVPAYNTEKYIYKCINSLISQNYSQLEIILINDGSTDGTLSVCRKFENQDKRIHVIDKANSGVSDSRNIGLKEATGKYIVFLDSDDYVDAEYISTLVATIEKNNAQMACVEYYLVDEDKNQMIEHASILNEGECRELIADEAIDLMNQKNAYQGYLWNKIFKRDILITEGIVFDTRVKIWEDMLFCLKYMLCVERVSYINIPLYYYVQRLNSTMGNKTNWNENTHMIALDEMWKLMKNKSSSFHDYIRDYYANDLAGMLGKEKYSETTIIKETIKFIESLEANLSLKHKLKICIFKWRKFRAS